MSGVPVKERNVRSDAGFTLIEVLVTATIAALIVAGLGGVIRASLEAKTAVEDRLALMQDAQFAMERMVSAVSNSRRLLLPLNDNPATGWPENIREQTLPASPPVGGSTLATAVLAVTLPAYVDLDFDGFPDADNDRDGRIDEDPGGDSSFDISGGIYLIDDDGDGDVDESGLYYFDDDEYELIVDEDPLNGIDDDGDGAVDEDLPADVNADGCAGICGVDDDADGGIDEGDASDDDEDGTSDEDWYDPVVFYLSTNTLRERTPVPWDETGVSGVTGRDFLTSDITSQVTRLRFERIDAPTGGLPLIDITLELTSLTGETVSLNRRVRVGGAL